MAEENKSPEVEIDTDGVNEETISVEAPEVSNEAFEKKQDVDLGYVDGESGYRKENNLKGTLLNEINSSEYKSLDNVGKSLALNTIFNERRQRAVERLTNNETMFPELYKLFEIVREEKKVKKMKQNLIDQFGGSAE